MIPYNLNQKNNNADCTPIESWRLILRNDKLAERLGEILVPKE